MPDRFVMLYSQDGKMILPLMDAEGKDIALFETHADARKATSENTMGAHFGYEIFLLGDGEQ